MKEAAGEANITVITILLIAIVAAVATPLITNLMNNTEARSCCLNAGGEWTGGDCDTTGEYADEDAYDTCVGNDNPNG